MNKEIMRPAMPDGSQVVPTPGEQAFLDECRAVSCPAALWSSRMKGIAEKHVLLGNIKPQMGAIVSNLHDWVERGEV